MKVALTLILSLMFLPDQRAHAGIACDSSFLMSPSSGKNELSETPKITQDIEAQLMELIIQYNQTMDPIKRTLLQKSISHVFNDLQKIDPNFNTQSFAKHLRLSNPLNFESSPSHTKEAKQFLPTPLDVKMISERELDGKNVDDKAVENQILQRLGIPTNSKYLISRSQHYHYSLLKISQPKFLFLTLGTNDKYFLSLDRVSPPIEIINIDPKKITAGSLFSISQNQDFVVFLQSAEAQVFTLDRTNHSIDFLNPILKFNVAEKFITHVVQKMELSPDKKYLGLFTANEFFLHDIANNQMSKSATFTNHGEISFSPDSRYVAITVGKSSYIYDLTIGLNTPVYSENLKIEYGIHAKLVWSEDSQNIAVAAVGQYEPLVGFIYNTTKQFVHPLAIAPLNEPLRWANLDIRWHHSHPILAIATSSVEKSVFASFDLRYQDFQQFEFGDYKPLQIKTFEANTVTFEGTTNKEGLEPNLERTYSLY